MQITVPKWLDLTINLLLLYILLVVGLTLGVWEYATWRSMGAIESNPGFVQRLSAYAQPGKTRQAIVNVLTVVDPAAKATHSVKSLGLGDTLARLTSLSPINMDALVESLDNFLAEGEKLKNQLDSLSQLNTSAAAVEQYMATPNKETQLLLYTSLVDHSQNIGSLIANIDSANAMMDSIAKSVSVIADTLEKTQSEGNFLTKQVASLLYPAVVPLQQKAVGFHDTLFTFSTTLAKDCDSINMIVSSTKQAISLEEQITPSVMRPLIHLITNHIFVFMSGVLVYILVRLRLTLRL